MRPRNLGQLTVWVALTRITRENGAMKFVPGSHRYTVGAEVRDKMVIPDTAALWLAANPEFVHDYAMGLFGQESLSDFSYFPLAQATMKSLLGPYSDLIASPTGDCETKVLEPGEAIIFTSTCMHGSWANDSDRDRYAVAARITTADAELRQNPGIMRIEPRWEQPELADSTCLRCPAPNIIEEVDDDEITLDFGGCEVTIEKEWESFARGLRSHHWSFTPADALDWSNGQSKEAVYECLSTLINEGVMTYVYDSKRR